MKKPVIACAVLGLVSGMEVDAVPPLVTGDVPTAEKETFEWYVGMQYLSEDGSISRELPTTTELVYGISDRQEVTFEMPYLSKDGEHGFGDVTLGTKYTFVKEAEKLPGISGVFEVKLPSASATKGLGTGSFDFNCSLPVQKTWGWFTALTNVGYTIVGDQKGGGIIEKRNNIWFLSFAQECEVTKKVKLLSEIYWEQNDEPGAPNRLAAGAGFEYKLRENLKVHGMVDRSLREGAQGGPDLRIYVGMEWDFDAPWKGAEK